MDEDFERIIRRAVLAIGLLVAMGGLLLWLIPPGPQNVIHSLESCGTPPIINAFSPGDVTYCASASRNHVVAGTAVMIVAAVWVVVGTRLVSKDR
jgi:hypothetical protein